MAVAFVGRSQSRKRGEGEEGEVDDDREEEEDSSPTGDETGNRRGLLSWLWEGEVAMAFPWRAGELEGILAARGGGGGLPGLAQKCSRSCASASPVKGEEKGKRESKPFRSMCEAVGRGCNHNARSRRVV